MLLLNDIIILLYYKDFIDAKFNIKALVRNSNYQMQKICNLLISRDLD